MVGLYPLTEFSIPAILTGETYQFQEPFPDFLNESFQNSPLFDALEKKGYEIDIYEPDSGLQYKIDDSILERFSNIERSSMVIDSYADFLKQLNTLVIYRYSPYYAKNNEQAVKVDFKSTAVTTSEGSEVFKWDNRLFYDSLSTPIKTIDNKCFKFIHLEGGHPSFHLDKNLNETQQAITIQYSEDVINSAFQKQLLGCCKMLDKFFGTLKENGIYDNSNIIVMADHGYDWELERGKNPLFYVKAKNETHENVEKTNLPLSYSDIDDIMVNILQGKSGDLIIENKYVDKNRPYFTYGWEEKGISKGTIMHEYAQAENIDEPLIETNNTFVNKWEILY